MPFLLTNHNNFYFIEYNIIEYDKYRILKANVLREDLTNYLKNYMILYLI